MQRKVDGLMRVSEPTVRPMLCLHQTTAMFCEMLVRVKAPEAILIHGAVCYGPSYGSYLVINTDSSSVNSRCCGSLFRTVEYRISRCEYLLLTCGTVDSFSGPS